MQVFYDVGIKREVLDLKVRCLSHGMGCRWTGELREAEVFFSLFGVLVYPIILWCNKLFSIFKGNLFSFLIKNIFELFKLEKLLYPLPSQNNIFGMPRSVCPCSFPTFDNVTVLCLSGCYNWKVLFRESTYYSLFSKCLLYNWFLVDHWNVSLNKEPCMTRPTLRPTLHLWLV